MLDDVKNALGGLYTAKETELISGEKLIHIYTGIFFDGESTGVYYEEPDTHTVRLYSDENYREWISYVTFDRYEYKSEIDGICDKYGVIWNEDKAELSITFRRNEMTLTEALMRLIEVMLTVGSFRRYVFFDGKY